MKICAGGPPMFWDILFYGIIIVGAVLMIALTAYRIDWARHPEKYKDIAEDDEPAEVTELVEKRAAAKKAKEKEKALKRQKRVDKVNHYRAINGKGPIGLDGKPKDTKKKK